MTRAPSALQYVDSKGVMRGFDLMPRDQWIVRNVTRWYALSSQRIMRMSPEMNGAASSGIDITHWHPDFGGDPDYYLRGHAGYARLNKYRARMSHMARVVETGQGHTAPLLNKRFVGHDEVQVATSFGARLCGLDGWVLNNAVSPFVIPHAMSAADIGTQIERTARMRNYPGIRVLSERELRKRDTIQHVQERDGVYTIPTTFMSEYRSSATAKPVMKLPDLAVVNHQWKHYIAVEVEHETDRPLPVYIEKLTAYRHNPEVDAVWYVCAHESTAKRVAAAAQRVFDGLPRPRVRIVPAHTAYGFWQIQGLEQATGQVPLLHEDLDVLNNRTTVRGLLYQEKD